MTLLLKVGKNTIANMLPMLSEVCGVDRVTNHQGNKSFYIKNDQ